MRRIVQAMMTTLNGRLDDADAGESQTLDGVPPMELTAVSGRCTPEITHLTYQVGRP